MYGKMLASEPVLRLAAVHGQCGHKQAILKFLSRSSVQNSCPCLCSCTCSFSCSSSSFKSCPHSCPFLVLPLGSQAPSLPFPSGPQNEHNSRRICPFQPEPRKCSANLGSIPANCFRTLFVEWQPLRRSCLATSLTCKTSSRSKGRRARDSSELGTTSDKRPRDTAKTANLKRGSARGVLACYPRPHLFQKLGLVKQARTASQQRLKPAESLRVQPHACLSVCA